MLAITLDSPRRFTTRELPEPVPGPGEVLVEVAAVAICGSDLSGYLGTHPRIRPPSVLGHEFSGTVAAVGDGVAAQVGDRVAVDPTLGCGQCRHCLRGRHNVCRRYRVMGEGLELPGAMAGRVVVGEAQLHRLPDPVSLESGALVQPLSVSYHAAIHRGGVQAGETVLVLGAGAIGLGIMLAAKAAGATVIVADVLAYRLELARTLGADAVTGAAEPDLDQVVADLTGGEGVDAAFEAVGAGQDELVATAVRAVCPGGRVVVVGLKSDQAAFPVRRLKYEELSIIGSQAHPRTFPAVIRNLAAGLLPAEPLISHRLPFSAADEAFGLLASRAEQVMKVVLVP